MQNKKRILLSVLVLILLSVLGYAAYAHHYQVWPFNINASSDKPANTVDYKKPTADQSSAGNAVKEKLAEDAKSTVSSSTSSEAKPDSVSMDITATTKTSGMLMIRTLIQTVTNSGSCTITMTNPDNPTYKANVGVQAMASTSTCQGFNIPLDSLGSGVWKVKVEFNDGAQSSVASTEVTI